MPVHKPVKELTFARLRNRAASALVVLLGGVVPLNAQHLSTYGTPGLIDMPSAETLNDADLAYTIAGFGTTLRNTLTFQALPRVYGSFRYSMIQNYFSPFYNFYDRSFDVHFQLREESGYWPALAVGIRDVVGTGVYSGEYIVATKTFGDRFSATAGLGWGRLAQRGGMSNPFCRNNNRWCTRTPGTVGPGGQPTARNWFRGDVAPFGGIKWDVNDRLTLLAEYSSDAYQKEVASNSNVTIKSPLNFGATYRFKNGASLSGLFIQGSMIGIQYSYVLNPKKPRNNAGSSQPPPPLLPMDQVAGADWNLPDRDRSQPGARQVLNERLKQEGIQLIGYSVSGDTVTVNVENDRYDSRAQAVGRVNRALANTLPPGVDKFAVVLSRNGTPITRITTHRSDLAELENHVDGTWKSLARADLSDAYDDRNIVLEDRYPRFDYSLGGFTRFSFFDPQNPIRADIGLQLDASLQLRPGLTLSGRLRQPIIETLDQSSLVSNSVLPHVRTDWPLYAKQSDIELNHLTAEYIWRPREDMFARVTAGYLEEMYGGVSAELLWYPVHSRLALGAEINYVRQREFDILFGFRDYNVTTGHGSIYYDFGNEFIGQVDMGRYLAGDWGATFSLDREFANGFKVGGYFTLTNVSAADFGEGSFDKGIRLTIPVSWITGKPSKRVFHQTIQPILRDGGARLAVRNRLYGYTRNERGNEITERWGRYFR